MTRKKLVLGVDECSNCPMLREVSTYVTHYLTCTLLKVNTSMIYCNDFSTVGIELKDLFDHHCPLPDLVEES